MKKTLFSIYIKYDLANKSLTISALSQIIMNILLNQDKSISIPELVSLLKTSIDTIISKERIDIALKDLFNENIVQEHNNCYQLMNNCRKKLENSISERTQRYNGIISKYFDKTDCSIQVIHKWFNEVNVRYFCEYSSKWINEIIGGKQKQKGHYDYIKIINDPKLYKKYNISEEDRKWLSAQYIKFLSSYDPIDNSLMWDYANSMFMARLLTSNIYIDKSIRDLFKDSKIVLDTNILMYLGLEKDNYSTSYRTLESIFQKMNIEPIYFDISEEEYKQAINYKIEDIKKIIEKYDYEVYSQTNDPFIKTAIYRSCKTENHFHTFFKEIYHFPKVLNSSLRLKKYDYSELNAEIEKGKNNQKLKTKMNSIYHRIHNKDKKDGSLEHDAGLIKGAEFLRKDLNCWILTRDGTVHSFSTENTKRNNYPIAVNLDTIINLLAMNDSGVAEDSSNYATLFANLVRSDIFPGKGIFQVEDLIRMYEIETQITQFPNEMIIEIAKDINNERFKGTNDSKIALRLNRRIQSYKMENRDKLMETNIKLLQSTDETDRQKKAYNRMEKAFIENRIKTLTNEYKGDRRRKVIISFFISIILIAVITLLFFIIIKKDNVTPLWHYILALGINILSNILTNKYLYFPLFNRKYNKKLANIDTEIKEEILRIRSQE